MWVKDISLQHEEEYQNEQYNPEEISGPGKKKVHLLENVRRDLEGAARKNGIRAEYHCELKHYVSIKHQINLKSHKQIHFKGSRVVPDNDFIISEDL